MTALAFITLWLLAGVIVAFVIQRFSETLQDSDAPPMLGVIVVFWPLALLMTLFYLIGKGVVRLNKTYDDWLWKQETQKHK